MAAEIRAPEACGMVLRGKTDEFITALNDVAKAFASLPPEMMK
jgi:hypothetical protein